MSKKQHILVWRLSAMGDVAMTVPVLKEVVKTYPTVQITVVSKPFFKPLFEIIPNVTFVSADVKDTHKGITGLFSLYKELKKSEITHVADLHNVLRSKIIRSFFKTNLIPIASINKGRAEKKELTKNAEKTIQQLKTTHQRYADVFATLGFPISLKPIEKNQLELSEKTLSITGKKKNNWIGIAPFAAFEGKIYPFQLMKEVLLELSKLDCKIFLFGGGEQETKKLDELSNEIPKTVSIASKLNFKDELSLISNLDVMISMDSGNAHLSAMHGIDTITLWGVTHPHAGFAPYMQPKEYQILPDMETYNKLPCSIYGNKIFKGYENVMESIAPEKMVKKVIDVIQKKEP